MSLHLFRVVARLSPSWRLSTSVRRRDEGTPRERSPSHELRSHSPAAARLPDRLRGDPRSRACRLRIGRGDGRRGLAGALWKRNWHSSKPAPADSNIMVRSRSPSLSMSFCLSLSEDTSTPLGPNRTVAASMSAASKPGSLRIATDALAFPQLPWPPIRVPLRLRHPAPAPRLVCSSGEHPDR